MPDTVRFARFDLTELKLVYRVLHRHLLEHTELMDTDFFEDLQRWLQSLAGNQNVDISDHSQWEAWLNDRPLPGSGGGGGRRTVIPLRGPEQP